VLFRRIFAFDRDASRLSTMRALLKKTDVECVTTTHKDFLRVDPHDPKYKDVEYILVDPSCSGSGKTDTWIPVITPMFSGGQIGRLAIKDMTIVTVTKMNN